MKAWAAALVGLVVLGPAWAAEPCKARRLALPVKLLSQRAIASVGINGTPVPLVVDSGAVFSMLTEPAAAQLKLTMGPAPGDVQGRGVTGRFSLRLTNIDKLQLPGGEIPNVDFMVGGNEMGGGSMGLLGRNFLATTDAEYDLAQGVIRLVYPEGDCSGTNMAYWAAASSVVRVPLQLDPWVRLPALKTVVKLNGVDVVALLDTGAQTLVSLAAARRAGVSDAQMKPAPASYGLGPGEAKSWTATFGSFALGGEQVTQAQLRVADFVHDDVGMLLGIDWFLAHHVYVAMGQKHLYFSYNGGPVFARNSAPDGAAEAPEPTLPDDADAYARRATARTARRDFVRALADLDRACEMAPAAAEYRLLRGQVQRALNHPAEAMKDFDEALRLDAAHPEARWARAQLRAAQGAAEPALDDLQALDRLLAPQADLHFEMARLYDRLHQPSLALPQLDRWLAAHRVEVRRTAALNSRCWARVLLNSDLAQALIDCNEALDLKPNNAQALDSRAWLHVRRAEWRAALDDFDQALNLRPDAAWSLYGRGIVRNKLGEAEAGRADIAAARQRLPSIDTLAGDHGLAADAGL